jgi:hypothetical protein
MKHAKQASRAGSRELAASHLIVRMYHYFQCIPAPDALQKYAP